mmetsp:Transcript_39532/g.85260  ORF Transcript_39532/g.85260 Transcript_39532/m.85260 type:complete len:460 (+) Transcript_39532:75-1454(+)
MVSTQARASWHVEEKKDDECEYSVAGNLPQSTDEAKYQQHNSLKNNESSAFVTNESNDSSEPKTKKSPLLLLLCASGITSCYLWYGTIQEHLFHMDTTEESGSVNESITLFLLATGTFSSFLLAWIWTIIGPILLSKKKLGSSDVVESKQRANNNQVLAGGRLNHPLIVLTSLAYLSAMSASNESLHYVSYPTCVLAKSAKLIPTMIVGWLVDQWRSRRSRSSSSSAHADNAGGKSINTMEVIGAALITIGIVSFQLVQLQKQANDAHNGEKEVKGDSPYGLALLGFSLFMDGLMAACQSVLKQKDTTNKITVTTNTISAYCRAPTAMETMLYINLYATFILLPASHYVGQFQRGIAMLCSNSSTKSILLLQLNLSAALGQVFIFLTIHHFSPLTCTTITTTRKFFTILLSVYKFGHVLVVWQWISIGLVFGGLYLQIAAKLFERHNGDHGGGKKKKVE